MASLLKSLKCALESSSPIDFDQPKRYELHVIDEFLSFREDYANLFHSALQTWMETVHKSLVAAISSRQNNQVKPKLQLVYTSAFNQLQKVKGAIENIGKLLVQETYSFQQESQEGEDKQEKQTRSVSQNNGLSGTNPIDRFWAGKTGTTCQQNCTFESFLPHNKNRSSSTGMRRKLSKTSCFAEAKKIADPGISTFHRPAKPAGTKIKKSKKREENTFDCLQKCLSSTSPSNFMLNYLVRTENQEEVKSNRFMVELHKSVSRSRSKRGEEEPQIVISGPSEGKKPTSQAGQSNGPKQAGNLRGESQTYEKVMTNFEERISSKLNQLMDNYTKIEQKLEGSEPHIKESKTQTSHIKESKTQTQQCLSLQPTTLKNQIGSKLDSSFNFKTITQNISEHSEPEKGKMVERGKPQESTTKATVDKENRKQDSRVAVARQMSKTVHGKNKILRNRTEESVPTEQSLQVIKLDLKDREQDGSQAIGKKVGEDSSKQNNAELQAEKEYIQSQIEKFRDITGKIVLSAVSGKFLHVLKTKYLSFCSHHRLAPSSSICNLETQSVTDQRAEMKENLTKMQRIVTLNCSADKKQKMLLYVELFLNCYLRFSKNCQSIKKEEKGRDAEALIKLALERLQE